MKCPKCGFQSFNYLPNCKKCGRDLSEIRDKYRLGDPVLPQYHAQQTAKLVPPIVDDPFETTLPDEKEISSTAHLVSLPDDEVDADLAEYFDEINAIDPELAATLDPDTDWAENTFALDNFDLETEEPAEPVLPQEEPGSDVAPVAEDPTMHGAPLSEAVAVPATAGLFDEDEEGTEGSENTQFLSDEDFFAEEDEGLDDWLLDGEEPAWRRTAAAISTVGTTPYPSVDEDDFSLGDMTVPAMADDDGGESFVREQAELPFEQASAISGQRASLPGRLLAILLDTGVLAAALALFVLAGEYLRRGQGDLAWPRPQDLTAQAGPYFLVFFGLAFGYFTLFHYLGGQTPGKMASKLLVVDLNGDPLQLSQAFLRSVGGLICLLPVGLGFFSVLLNCEGRGWNDRLAGSVVVAAHEDESES